MPPMDEPQWVLVTRNVLRVGLIVAGCLMVLAGLFLTFLVVAMFSSPSHMGTERLLGPIFGFFALVLFFCAVVCFRLSPRMKPGSPNAQSGLRTPPSS
jgi:ABC-type enterochelin transport system permease subunit